MEIDIDMTIDIDALAHHGVKGMRWGVRNADGSSGYNAQVGGPTMDPRLPSSVQTSGKEVARLMNSRYGFEITEMRAIESDHPEYNNGLAAYVESTPGKKGGVIYASTDRTMSAQLKEAESGGWFAKDTGTMKALLTHESAHAMFHAEQKVKMGLLSSKVVGGEMKARDAALKAAIKTSKNAGIHEQNFLRSISGYAVAANMREEAEAEMFSQYHWSENPPAHIKVWGETLHKELGVDPTPFRESR